MSFLVNFLAGVPVTEILASTVGFLVAAYSLLDLIRTERSSNKLARLLRKETDWQRFEIDQLRSILSDRKIDPKEWDLILEKVDRIAAHSSVNKQSDIDSIYPARSTKAKKLLISDMLSHTKEAA